MRQLPFTFPDAAGTLRCALRKRRARAGGRFHNAWVSQCLLSSRDNMLEHVFLLTVIAFAFFWGAWRDHATGNGRDSKLMAFLGGCASITSAGIYLAGA